MSSKLAEKVFKPIKPTSVHSGAERAFGWSEYQAEQQATLDRMAKQRAARMSALDLVRMKNRPG
jgi:hypothetical protein